MKAKYLRILASLVTAVVTTNGAFAAGEKKTITGEVMDTWCYVSQIMGGADFVVGTAHHVCAVWCAAGGIPVGLLDKDDGKIYMIMSVGDDSTNVASEALLDIQSHEITVNGTVFELDGLNYITVDEIVADSGVTNLTHEIIGILPSDADPR